MCPEDLPMTAAHALAMGLDTPALCELAGLPRDSEPLDIRDTFEQALDELGIILPDHHVARRYALRRPAARFSSGEADLAELVSDEWSEMEVENAEEQAFVTLLPPACDSGLAVEPPLAGHGGRLHDFSRPDSADVLKSLLMLWDPGLPRLKRERSREAVVVVDGHGQGAVLMHVEDQAQPAAATDARVRTRRELGQVALPGIEVLLERDSP